MLRHRAHVERPAAEAAGARGRKVAAVAHGRAVRDAAAVGELEAVEARAARARVTRAPALASGQRHAVQRRPLAHNQVAERLG